MLKLSSRDEGLKSVPRRALAPIVALILWLTAIFLSPQSPAAIGEVDPFLVKPYVQLGDGPEGKDKSSFEILWIAREGRGIWSADVKRYDDDKWHSLSPVRKRVISRAMPNNICLFSVQVRDLEKGTRFDYRVSKNNAPVLSASALVKKRKDQDSNFIVVGDIGAGSSGQRRIAEQIHKAQPDYVVIPGDIVYDRGRLSEYFTRFFPILNSEGQGGFPLMRSTLFVPVLGNHDIALSPEHTPTNLEWYPDALAYFLVWSSPLNGPLADEHGPNIPSLYGGRPRVANFQAGAGSRYPRMANYSFDYGNVHWLVLDANHYMDWTNRSLRQWVRDDLTSAKTMWKFVTFHQPGFSNDYAHYKEQRMRHLCELFEQCGVDIVFCGHAHNYQRSFPLKFRVRSANADGTIDGDIALDKTYDGVGNLKPNGIIYIVTGAGGARLYRSIDVRLVESANFIEKMVTDCHSYTLCQTSGKTLKIQQISDYGKLLDQFTLSKD